MTQPFSLDCFGLTDPGRVRDQNEDQFLIAELARSLQVHRTSIALGDYTAFNGERRGHLLMVADGMGGAPAGERASAIAVRTIIRYMLDVMPAALRIEGAEDLEPATEACQSNIEADAAAHPERRGMGTTLTLAYVVWPRAHVVHVGDSRCYLLRARRLSQVTRDHSLAQRMADHGLLAEDAARRSRWGSVIWNVIGGASPDLEPELHTLELRAGDALLVCTDGLTRHVPDPAIADLLECDSAETACRRLVDAANRAGGGDNITVVVARFVERAPTGRERGRASTRASADGVEA